MILTPEASLQQLNHLATLTSDLYNSLHLLRSRDDLTQAYLIIANMLSRELTDISATLAPGDHYYLEEPTPAISPAPAPCEADE